MENRVKERFIRKIEDRIDNIIKLCDIWMVNIGRTEGSVQSGHRPMLVVSNNVNNYYSRVINAVPMTSKMNKKNLPCHVEIWNYERYGLFTPSTIMIEQIASIPKENFMYKMGEIHDIELLINICHAMESQFPLLELS